MKIKIKIKLKILKMANVLKSRRIGVVLVCSVILFNIILYSFKGHINDERNSKIILSTDSHRWIETWGGEGDEEGYAIAVDSDDNIYIAGYTDSEGEGDKDMLLMKYDNSGEKKWHKTWGGNGTDIAYCIGIDYEENIYIAGYTNNTETQNEDIVLVKYNKEGKHQWDRIWGDNFTDIVYDLAIDTNNNIYLTGYTNTSKHKEIEVLLLKYSSSGNYQWNSTYYNHKGFIKGFGIAIVPIDPEGKIYVVGEGSHYGLDKYYQISYKLLRFTLDGDFQEGSTWGGEGDQGVKDILIDFHDNVYLVGYSEDIETKDYDLTFIGYESAFSTSESQLSKGGDSWGESIAVDSFNTFYVAGYMENIENGDYDIIIINYDFTGYERWHSIWRGKEDDYGYGITLDSKNNIYIAGSTKSQGEGGLDIIIIKNPEPQIELEDIIYLIIFSALGIFGLILIAHGYVILLKVKKKSELSSEKKR